MAGDRARLDACLQSIHVGQCEYGKYGTERGSTACETLTAEDVAYALITERIEPPIVTQRQHIAYGMR